jgi:hypothetical protein
MHLCNSCVLIDKHGRHATWTWISFNDQVGEPLLCQGISNCAWWVICVIICCVPGWLDVLYVKSGFFQSKGSLLMPCCFHSVNNKALSCCRNSNETAGVYWGWFKSCSYRQTPLLTCSFPVSPLSKHALVSFNCRRLLGLV